MPRSLLLCVVCLGLPGMAPALGQDSLEEIRPGDVEEFVNSVLVRFKDVDREADRVARGRLLAAFQEWKKDRKVDAEAIGKLNQVLLEIGRTTKRAESMVTISTEEAGDTVEGLTLKYRMIGLSEETTAKSSSTCEDEEMIIGWYYIRALRGDRDVSADPKNVFKIVEEREKVDVPVR